MTITKAFDAGYDLAAQGKPYANPYRAIKQLNAFRTGYEHGSHTSFVEHMRAKFGPVWVVARRTKSIVRQYGADVVTLTPAAFQKERAAWQEQQA